MLYAEVMSSRLRSIKSGFVVLGNPGMDDEWVYPKILIPDKMRDNGSNNEKTVE